MPSTGRVLGPFADVSTERVEGAYEVCLGTDAEGRQVEILTLGSTSSKDPARRRLLGDAVAWARGTQGPRDAPVLDVQLEAEQPYVVTLHDENLRGVGRLLDWLLRMGPSTGPLPRITAPVPPHLMRPTGPPPPPGSPVVGPPAPPMAVSPAAAPSAFRRRMTPGVILLTVLLAFVVFGGGAVAVLLAQDEENTSAPPSGQDQGDAAPDEQGETGAAPEPGLDDGTAERTVEGWPSWTTKDVQEEDYRTMASDGWPFAWRYDTDFTCTKGGVVEADARAIVCEAGPEAGEQAALIEVRLTPCPGECMAAERAEGKPTGEWVRLDADTELLESPAEDTYEVSMLRFFVDSKRPQDGWWRVYVHATAPQSSTDTVEAVRKSVNDIYAQAD